MITTNDIYAALRHVEEPDLKQDLVSLGMIKDVEIKDDSVRFTVILTTPACPLKELIRSRCEEAIHTHVGSHLKVFVDMTANVTSIRSSNNLLPHVKNIIAVASGKGGVGKSTVTANLALALSQTGASVGIIDADIFGPSIPTMFGGEDVKPGIMPMDGKNWIVPVELHGVKIISIGFLTPADQAIVWRGPMASTALRQFINDVHWGELDYLLIDLPPGTSDIHLTLVQTVPVTGAVIVTTPQKVALTDVVKGLAMFRQPQINVPVLGIVENMAYFTPAELPDNKYYLFGKEGGRRLAQEYKVPLLGEVPLVQGIREGGDSGQPAALQSDGPAAHAFHEIAEQLARQVAIRNAGKPPSEIVEITT